MNWDEAHNLTKDFDKLLTPDLGEILFNLAVSVPDGKTILEVGAFKGYSTCLLALACIGTRKRVLTIDTFKGIQSNTDEQGAETYYPIFDANLSACGVRVGTLIGTSELFYDLIPNDLGMVFIDGDHRAMNEDFDALYPKLASGGWLAMHDIYANSEMYLTLNDCLDGFSFKLNLAWGAKREGIH
jgi:predicted O-methyltransferase YrrM